MMWMVPSAADTFVIVLVVVVVLFAVSIPRLGDALGRLWQRSPATPPREPDATSDHTTPDAPR